MGTGTNVLLGMGTVYVAAIGTTEPVSASASVSSFRDVGYTDGGAVFSYELTSEKIEVDQEFDPIRWETTARNASIAFPMAEATRQNLALALNAGAAAANDATSFEPPDPGDEVRVMIVFDPDDGGRWIFRQCIQAGNLEIARRKAPAKALLPVTFRLEKPAGAAPFRVYPTFAGLI
jgi:hypothetical protein